MKKSIEKLPTVFLACPFNKDMDKLKKELMRLPWKVETAKSEIKNDHLLKKIKSDIRKADLALFDITGWNPNVCLELGLAHGMNKKYYILNNNTVMKDAISDIKGIERIDYNWNKKKKAASLFEQLKDGVFKRKYISKEIWDSLNHNNPQAEKLFMLALTILAQFKGERKQISKLEIKNLSRGLNLKKEVDFDDLIACLIRNRVLEKSLGRRNVYKVKRHLYNSLI